MWQWPWWGWLWCFASCCCLFFKTLQRWVGLAKSRWELGRIQAFRTPPLLFLKSRKQMVVGSWSPPNYWTVWWFIPLKLFNDLNKYDWTPTDSSQLGSSLLQAATQETQKLLAPLRTKVWHQAWHWQWVDGPLWIAVAMVFSWYFGGKKTWQLCEDPVFWKMLFWINLIYVAGKNGGHGEVKDQEWIFGVCFNLLVVQWFLSTGCSSGDLC